MWPFKKIKLTPSQQLNLVLIKYRLGMLKENEAKERMWNICITNIRYPDSIVDHYFEWTDKLK